ncbi:unnamed protein product [Macrosiphum euphorbiae]|uniref:DUF4371 domain-containing protein n=1 Tax=Macrosiphum euphorbiae TaxID=13131 RepID=A0AAV0WMM1_9HEMI|nr:unnamed protein product [Macrosiphum euphorbiae]
MSKRKITDFFSQNKITKTSEPQDSHHDTIDTDLDELPTPTYTKKGKEKRFYNKKWENDFPWLFFDVQRNGAFCKLCEKHAVNDSVLLTSTGGVFIKTPFNNFKKALGKYGKLNKYNDSASHIRSIEQERLTLVFSKNPVYCQILNQSSEECKINRKHFSLLFRSIYFLAKEEIAHTTKYEPLIKRLIMKSSESFESWIVTNSDRSTYISKATASELLCCASEILCKKLNNEVIGKKFSLMADESTNVNNKSELSICIRFVKNNQPVEQFIGIRDLSDTKAHTIVNEISSELTKHNLSYQNIIACGFDGAANMSGNKSGVRRLISEKAGREVPYIHCRAHALSLALTR